MGVLKIRISEDKLELLKSLARSRGVGVRKLLEDLSVSALARLRSKTGSTNDAEGRFLALATGSVATGLVLLDKLDAAFVRQK